MCTCRWPSALPWVRSDRILAVVDANQKNLAQRNIFLYFGPPQTHAVGDVVRGRVCRHIKRRLLTLCGGHFETSQLSIFQTAQSSSECPLGVYNYCTYHTGNLHIRRGLQVACYGLVKALRRPQRERDEPIRTPRFFYCVYLVRGRG